MCFRTGDGRAIHNTAQDFISRIPKEHGTGTKLVTKPKILRVFPEESDPIVGKLHGFDENSQTIQLKIVTGSTDAQEPVIRSIPFATPAEKI